MQQRATDNVERLIEEVLQEVDTSVVTLHPDVASRLAAQLRKTWKNCTCLWWIVDDVRSVPGGLKLTVGEALSVLDRLQDVDCNVGVNWGTIEGLVADVRAQCD